jgi:uncharacterized heparinase superfamily protein
MKRLAPAEMARFARTVHHLRARQIFWRARYSLDRLLGLGPRVNLVRSTPDRNGMVLAALQDYARAMQRISPPAPGITTALREGCFTYLHHTERREDGPPWDRHELPRLWRYQLHSFSFARDFAVENAALTWREDGVLLRTWIAQWQQAHPPGVDVAWDAYTVSARLLHWALAAAVFRWDDAAFWQLYALHAEWLTQRIEWDIDANHLLKNAAALSVAGALIGEGMPQAGPALLQRCVTEQVLADGAHVERSPMYHALVLEDLLLAHAALPRPQAWLDTAIRRMTQFLADILHPDGEIPLFGDAVLREALPARRLMALAADRVRQPPRTRQEGSYSLPESGFHVLGSADAQARMILKAGAPGPPHQLGHAHCDQTSYEISVADRRMITDSGMHGYAESPLRQDLRGTAAHNVAQVNALEQHECWGVFRVGRRAQAHVLDWQTRTEGAEIRLAHDGFAPWHCMRRVLFDGTFGWQISDHVQGPPCAFVSRIHFHPDADVRLEESEGRRRLYVVRVGRVRLGLVTYDCDVTLALPGGENAPHGWYCPEFGLRQPAPVITLTAAPEARRIDYTFLLPHAFEEVIRQTPVQIPPLRE